MPCTIKLRLFQASCLLLISILMFACDNDLDPTPSSTRGPESPRIQAEITLETFEELSTSTSRIEQVTEVTVKLYDVSDGNMNPFSLVTGDSIVATAVNTGASFDFSSDTKPWDGLTISETDATASVSHDSLNDRLLVNTVWDDATDDVVAVVGDLFRPLDLSNGSITLDVYVPLSYVDDGNLQIQMIVIDSSNNVAALNIDGTSPLSNTINVSSLNGDEWNTISSTNIDDSLLIGKGDNFTLTNVRLIGLQIISNEKPTSVNGTIELDNVVISVQPTERSTELQSSFDNTGEPIHTAKFFNGGVSGQPITVDIERTTPPEDIITWFPTDDTTAPDFDVLYFNAPNSTVTVPYVDVTSPDSSVSTDLDTYYTVETDSVTIEWSPSGSSDELLVAYQSNCLAGRVFTQSGTIEITGDPGFVTFLIDEFLQEQIFEDRKFFEEMPCEILVRVEKNAAGVIDPTFSGNSFINALHESKSIVLYSSPPSS